MTRNGWWLEVWNSEKATLGLKCPSCWPEEFLESAFIFTLVLQIRKWIGPSSWRKEQCSHDYTLPLIIYVFISFIKFFSSQLFFSSSGKKNPLTSSPRILCTVPIGLALNPSMPVGYSVSSGSLAFRIGHASHTCRVGIWPFHKVQGIKESLPSGTFLSAAW